MTERLVWIDARPDGAAAALAGIDPALALGAALVPARMAAAVPAVRVARVGAYVECAGELDDVPHDAIVVGDDEEVLRAARRRGFATAWYAAIGDERTMRAACDQVGVHDYVIAELADATNIPLELLLAVARRTATKVLKRVRDVDDARVAGGVLERGCDGVLVSPPFERAGELAAWQRAADTEPLTLESAVVSDVQAVGVGDRVCVDTVEMLGPNDGMIVGSTAHGGLVVCAEVHPLPYMKLRPFRVNAGALHSYTAAPGNRTAYLSELVAGDAVLVATTSGEARTVVVGRAKTERRPLLKVAAEHDGIALNAVVQNDWHVRVFDADRRVRSVTELRPGDRVLVALRLGGRHVGHAVDERLWEA